MAANCEWSRTLAVPNPHIINESGSYAVFIYETHLALQPFLINVSLIELKSKIIRTV